MKELVVGLGDRSYPIQIGQGILTDIGTKLEKLHIGKRFCVISDDRVSDLYGKVVMDSLAAAGLVAELITFPRGEKNKTLVTIGKLASQMASLGFDRKDAIIALGGGVVGDMAGFLAATYMRGIDFVQVPTTLLAQVDSSVGGKTGVDIPEGKNLIGCFYQPRAVYIDTEVLSTLEKEELLGGLAEVIKYGVIRDRAFFDYLRENREAVMGLEPDSLVYVIERCCQIKADVVSEDEKEGGVRKILNYGHTIGHAVEGASGYSLIHGLAVSIGMVAAARLAEMKRLLDEKAVRDIISILQEYQMPIEVPAGYSREAIKKFLSTDKKVEAGTIFFILPDSIGSTRLRSDVTAEEIDIVLK